MIVRSFLPLFVWISIGNPFSPCTDHSSFFPPAISPVNFRAPNTDICQRISGAEFQLVGSSLEVIRHSCLPTLCGDRGFILTGSLLLFPMKKRGKMESSPSAGRRKDDLCRRVGRYACIGFCYCDRHISDKKTRVKRKKEEKK